MTKKTLTNPEYGISYVESFRYKLMKAQGFIPILSKNTRKRSDCWTKEFSSYAKTNQFLRNPTKASIPRYLKPDYIIICLCILL